MMHIYSLIKQVLDSTRVAVTQVMYMYNLPGPVQLAMHVSPSTGYVVSSAVPCRQNKLVTSLIGSCLHKTGMLEYI